MWFPKQSLKEKNRKVALQLDEKYRLKVPNYKTEFLSKNDLKRNIELQIKLG